MADFIPERRKDVKSDDIQDIERDIKKLAQKYLSDIDAIRSIVRPINQTTKNADECVYEVEIDQSRPLESRVHAFYRYIGFPVAVKSGEFYNPGFDPNGSLKKTFRADVNKKFLNSSIKTIVDQREENFEINRSLFARQDLSATVYALLLTEMPRPFSVIADDIPALDVDKQEFHINAREDLVDDFFLRNDNFERSEIQFLSELQGANFTNGVHLLKPFIVDPAIDCMAMPAKNRIAVPFLKNKDELKIEDNVSVLRPGIELIISERLRASELVDTVFLETVKQILNNEVSPNTFLVTQGGTLEGQELISTVSALLGKYEKDVETSDLDELSDITRIQTEVISQLVRSLKSILNTLYNSIQVVLKASDEINWAPIPNVEGPEFGAKKAILRTLNVSSTENEIDKTIILLKRKKITAEHQKTSKADRGNFASPFSVKTNDESLDLITSSLRDAEQKRDKIANDAFVAMGNIELIMGEASGLGLADVLSIYIALWSMDETSLISLLDSASFNRLKTNFPDLAKVGAAASRDANQGKPEKQIVEALDDFESKLKNVFKFADIEFLRKFIQDGEEAGGDIYADE